MPITGAFFNRCAIIGTTSAPISPQPIAAYACKLAGSTGPTPIPPIFPVCQTPISGVQFESVNFTRRIFPRQFLSRQLEWV
jgi:hypothetical protein